MPRSRSEIAFGSALRAVNDSVPTYVYRPPDIPAPGTTKPCDFMAWTLAHSIDFATDPPGTAPTKLVDVAWFECKQLAAGVAESFRFGLLEKSQRQGIREAMRIGIDYWLAVYWQRHGLWTISDAVRLEAAGLLDTTSMSRTLLSSKFGIDARPGDLTSVLKSILAGEVR